MRTAFLIGMIGAALALSGCGGKGEGNEAGGSAPAKTLAAVPAPAGTKWSETIAETPAGGIVMGNPKAELKLVEYASFTCPHCRDLATEADEPLRQKVDTGKISYEFRAFVRDPLDIAVNLLAHCGGKDPFFPLAHQLFGYQETMFKTVQGAGEAGYQSAMSLPPNQRFVKLAELAGLIEFVKQRGIAEQQARTCLADFKKAEKMGISNEAAMKQFNVQGTPTIILNDQVLENAATWPMLQARLAEHGA